VPEENVEGPSPQYPEAQTPAEWIAEAFAVRFRKVPWIPAEIAPAAVVAAVLLFAVTEIAAGVIIGLGEGLSGVAAPLIAVATWSDPVLVAVLLASVLLSWNEVTARCDDLDFFSNSDDDVTASEVVPGETITRLCRSRFLATSALAAALLASAASVSREIGVAMEQFPHEINGSIEAGAFNAQTWAGLIEGAGIALAVLVLTFACAVVVLRVRRIARVALMVSESDLADSNAGPQ
jgi:hypothetical protein